MVNLNYIYLLRPRHWAKNLFMFIPIFFSGSLFTVNVLDNILGFIAFSFLASSIYIFNDIIDIEKDKLHPEKKNRPLPSGKINLKLAILISIVLLIIGFFIAFSINIYFASLVLSYIIINILYSLFIKNISILDAVCIALGFEIRVFAGATISGIEVSLWLVMLTFLLTLMMAIAKRRDDVVIFNQTNIITRKSSTEYNLEFINSSVSFMASVILVCYIMYTISDEVKMRLNSDKVYLSSIMVVISLLRYLQITFVDNNSGSPTKILYQDKIIQINILLWILFYAKLIYFPDYLFKLDF